MAFINGFITASLVWSVYLANLTEAPAYRGVVGLALGWLAGAAATYGAECWKRFR